MRLGPFDEAKAAALARDGQGIRAIVRETGLSRNTVRHWLRTGTAPTWCKGERARITDPFVPYLVRRLDEGERNATRLWRELQASGFRGGVMVIGATSVIRVARQDTPGRLWAKQLLERKPARVVSVALANKTARIAWAVLTRGEVYRAASAA